MINLVYRMSVYNFVQMYNIFLQIDANYNKKITNLSNYFSKSIKLLTCYEFKQTQLKPCFK